MSNFIPSHAGFAASPSYGAAHHRRKRKPPVSSADYKKILSDNRWLRDEDRQLHFAFDKKMGKQARRVFRKLARIRDNLRKRAMNAIRGTTGKQIVGRTYLALSTAGVSELFRLALKSPIEAKRKRVATRYLKKAHAADVLLRYWRRKFWERLHKAKKEGTNAQFDRGEFEELYAAVAEGEQLEGDGASETMVLEQEDEPIDGAVASAAEGEDDDDDGLAGTGLTPMGALVATGLGALAGLFI